MRISILYFAQFSQDTNIPGEQLELEPGLSAAELFNQLARRYRFTLSKDACRAAVNETFVDWDHILEDKDTLAFIPPVNGG